MDGWRFYEECHNVPGVAKCDWKSTGYVRAFQVRTHSIYVHIVGQDIRFYNVPAQERSAWLLDTRRITEAHARELDPLLLGYIDQLQNADWYALAHQS